MFHHVDRDFTKTLKEDRKQYERKGWEYLFSDGKQMHFIEYSTNK